MRHERRVGGRHVCAEDLVEALPVDRHLDTAVRQRPRLEEVTTTHDVRRKARLQVSDRFALVGRESGHVHEPYDLLRGSGDGDHAPAVRMADEHDRPIDLVDDRAEIRSVTGDPAKRNRRRENRVVVAVEAIEHAAPTRGVSERAVSENDGWL